MEVSLERKSTSNCQRILICASTAITSAIAILTLTWYRRKRRRRVLKGQCTDGQKGFKEEPSSQDIQLELAAAKLKDLEATLSLTETEKDLLSGQFGEALKKLKTAAQTEKDLKHQLGKVKFASKEYEDSYNLVHKTKEEALIKARQLEAEKKESEAQLNSSRASLSGMQRSLAAETGARKAAERRVKQLELDVSSALSSKANTERKCQQKLQELQKGVEEAEASRKLAEQELERYRAQVAPTRAKIGEFGQRYVSLQESYQSVHHALQQSEQKCVAEHKARRVLEPRVKAAEARVIELEKELRITREAARSRMNRTSSRSSLDSR